GNSARSLGGGLFLYRGSATIQNSTFFGNQSNNRGGGLVLYRLTATVQNTTISGNSACYGGGGVYSELGTVTLKNNIIAGNSPNSGANDILRFAGTLNVNNSLIQNMSDGAINGTNTANIFGQAALLGPLQNNGGPTKTMALLSGSPAHGGGVGTAGVTTDQRG